MAQAAQAAQVVMPAVRNFVADAACTDAGSAGGVPGVAGVGAAAQPEPPVKPKPRPPSHYLWAALIARIYEVFPLLCPVCGGQMRIILETAVGRARVGCDGVRWQG